MTKEKQKEYHVLSLSGGKDSTALAFYIKDNMPEIHEQIEYVFCDTECELPETYEYLDKIEVFLDKKITRIKPYKSFEHLYEVHGLLPNPFRRWCTFELKTKTFRKHIEDKLKNSDKELVNLYIGIRADEAHRATDDKSIGAFLKAQFPFVIDGLNKIDIENILMNCGIGFPDYYEWRSRSGCYFCFYQRKIEWVKLHENHPELFKKAMSFEHENCKKIKTGSFSWIKGLPLKELIKPDNVAKIKEYYENQQNKIKSKDTTNLLFDVEEEGSKCILCHL